MKKMIICVMTLAMALVLTAAVTFTVTMNTLKITTDDGENAQVSAFGQVWYKVIFADDETEFR